MTTYLIDCGPNGDLLELGRRVVAYLGPEAALGRPGHAAYGDPGARAPADVFIGLQATGVAGAETWVHPRSGHGSRALAETVHAELARHGARGGPRIGELPVLVPERHAPGAAACVIEVDDRVRHAGDAAATDDLAHAIARAARGARYSGAATAAAAAGAVPAVPAAARGLEEAAQNDDPRIRLVHDLVTRASSDAALRQRLLDDPIAALAALGVQVPAELQAAFAQHLREIVQARPVSAGQAWSRGLEAPAITAEVQSYGVVFALNNQATQDLVNGSNVIAGLLAAAAAAAAIPAATAAAVLGVLSGVLWAMASLIALVNRGNGVYLTVPWTAILPPPVGAPVVFPTPR